MMESNMHQSSNGFVSVPATLSLERAGHMGRGYSLSVDHMYGNWATTTSTVVHDGPNFAILTGCKSAITVIDTTYESVFLGNTEFMTVTPSRGAHHYFQYESKLQSIYDTLPGVSVLNDGRYVFAGYGYPNGRNHFIPKMPESVLNQLLSSQERRFIHDKFYDLLMRLPDEWFQDDDKYTDLCHGMRNSRETSLDCCVDTMRTAIVDKFGYRPKTFDKPFREKISAKRERFAMCALGKKIRVAIPDDYDLWKAHWKHGNPNRKPVMTYQDGSLTKLSDLKAKHTGELTAKMLAEMNPRWTSVKLKICKNCEKRHLKGCCDSYSSINRTCAVFIKNVTLTKM